METVLIIIGIVAVISLVILYFKGMIDAMKGMEARLNAMDKDMDTIYVDIQGVASHAKSLVNNTEYMADAINKLREQLTPTPKPKVIEIPLKNAKWLKDSLFVVEHEDYMQLCTKDGYILPCNISVSVTDNVNEPLTATATFHVKKGRIVK